MYLSYAVGDLKRLFYKDFQCRDFWDIAFQNCVCYNAGRQRNVTIFHAGKERSPQPCCSTVEGFFFSFIVAKHPLGYLLSLSCLSSHLLMRWQTTPAETDTRNVTKNSTQFHLLPLPGIGRTTPKLYHSIFDTAISFPPKAPDKKINPIFFISSTKHSAAV